MKRRILACVLALCCAVGCGLMIPADADNSAPVAENFEFETYRGVSFGGQLAAVDPEGDTLSFEITTEPVKGTIELGEDGSFVYTPIEGKRGKDYFGYKAVDAEGNKSQEATVIIRLVKNKSGVSYVDMNGNASYCSAVRLAECGAYLGKQIGADRYFEPDEVITRGEFLSMCLEATGTDLLKGVVSTGFVDDADIPDWLKSYAATAVKSGIIKGHASAQGALFDPDDSISSAEAMVILNRTLRLSDVSHLDCSGVPDWAAQAAANLEACGIAGAAAAGSSPLTRAEAADMLAAAMALLESR